MNLYLMKVVLLVCLASFMGVQAAKESRARQNFHCDDALNKQIKMEFDAAQTYLSLASHFSHDSVALKGFAKFFKSSWKEELEHAEKLIEYGITRGSNVQTPSVNKPDDSKWESLNACEIVEFALNLEKSVNAQLHQLHSCGEEDESNKRRADPQFQDFIEGNYLGEQVEANKELADLHTRLSRATQYINSEGKTVSSCNGLGLHLIDQELAK